MAGFGSPFGLGYGLGVGGADAAQGMLQGQIRAPQLVAQNLQNTALQRQLQTQSAENQAFSQSAPDTGQPELSPYDKMLNDMKYQHGLLSGQGQGLAANQLQSKMIDMNHQRMGFLLQQGSRAAMLGSFDQAKQYLNSAGMKVDDLSQDDKGNYVVTSNGNKFTLSPIQVMGITADPNHLLQSYMMNNWHMGQLGINQQKADTSRQRADAYTALTQMRPDLMKQQMAASLQRAGIMAGERRFEFQNRPEQNAFAYYTLPKEKGGLGLSPDDALGSIDQGRSLRSASGNPALQAHQAAQTWLKGQEANGKDVSAQELLNYQNALLGVAGQASLKIMASAKDKATAQQNLKAATKPQTTRAPGEIPIAPFRQATPGS